MLDLPSPVARPLDATAAVVPKKPALPKFTAPWWLRNTHLQTIVAKYLAPKRQLQTRVEMLQLPDGDELQLNWVLPDEPSPSKPLVVVMHGLEGNLHSHYVQGMLTSLSQQGFAAVLMHFRGCHGIANKLPRAYHSGDTADFGFFIELLQQRYPKVQLAAVGFSLGGNVLVKYCGEQQQSNPLCAAVAISAPLSLAGSATRINRGFSRVYQRYLLNRLKATMLRKLAAHQQFPLPISAKDIQGLQTIRDFDQLITAPMHGYRDADDYYQRASGKAFLSQVQKPLLLVHALDDPFLDDASIPKTDELNPYVFSLVSVQGGHVGFVHGQSPWQRRYWLDEIVPDFFQQMLQPTQKAKPE